MNKLETSDDYMREALRYSEQAKHERDPVVIAHCQREASWWLAEAAKLEKKGL